MLQPDEKPDISYADIGGMDMQKQEIREAVELPLTHFELYKQIGIDPPRGVLSEWKIIICEFIHRHFGTNSKNYVFTTFSSVRSTRLR